jgi:hypothetical protein
MDFTTALTALKIGQKIARQNWPKHDYMYAALKQPAESYTKELLLIFVSEDKHACDATLRGKDIFATDWIILDK